MQRIVLFYLLLFSFSVHGHLDSKPISDEEEYITQCDFSIHEDKGKDEIIKQKIEKDLPYKNSVNRSLDTIYFPFYNGVQMIMVCHLKLYYELYNFEIERSIRMSQGPYIPPAPEGDEYFFRDVEWDEYFFRDVKGDIVNAYNTAYSLKELSAHFQSTLGPERKENYHVEYFVDPNLYYSSENRYIHNGFYMINNGCRQEEGWTQDEGLLNKKTIKYGLIDTLGNVVLDTLYDDILLVPNGFLLQKDKKWGVIDKNQEVALPFEYERHTTNYYNFDNYRMEKELTYFYKDGRYAVAYFMRQDSLIFLEDYYQILSPKRGLFIRTENGKYGVIDLVNNKVLLPPVYQDPYFQFHDPSKDPHHLEHTYVIAKKNGKYGMVNLKNKVILPFKYDEIYNKHESRKGYFKVELNGKTIEIEH